MEISDSMVLSALIKNYEMMRVRNAVRNTKKYNKYCKAIQLLDDFLKNGRGTANVDDPEEKISCHSVRINLENEIFEESDIKQLIEIEKLFDSMIIDGDTDCNVSVSFMMDNIYVGETEND